YRLPVHGNPILELRGCTRARPDPGPGPRSVRQLLQPRALRPADDVAVGTADRVDQRRLSGRPARGHPVPSDLSLRDHLEPARADGPAADRTPLSAALGQAHRALLHLLR